MTAEDVRIAAELALPHRRRRDPFDEPGITDEQLDDAMREAEQEAERARSEQSRAENESASGAADSENDLERGFEGDADTDGGPENNGSDGGPDDQGPDDDGPAPPGGGPRGGAREGSAGAPAKSAARPPHWEIPGVGEGAPGRRSRARTRHGRVVRSVTDTSAGLHLLGTLFAAAPHQHARGRVEGPLTLEATDLRGAYREGREGNLVVFVVDASGSMAARERMRQVKTAILSLLLDAYRRRDRVGVVTFRDQTAEIALPPTGSIDIAARRLDGLPAGGRTPLAEGLMKAAEVVQRERLRDPSRRPLLVIVTDGRATFGADPVGRAHQVAAHLVHDGVSSIVVDCESGRMRMGLAADLAEALKAEHVPIGRVNAQALADIVRGATTPGAA